MKISGNWTVGFLKSAIKLKKQNIVHLVVRVSANALGVCGLIPGQVIPKTQKIVFDASLLNTQHLKGMDQSQSGAIQGKE